MNDKLSERIRQFWKLVGIEDDDAGRLWDGESARWLTVDDVADEVTALEQRVEGLEKSEIRVGADDEYVHGPLFHMERMSEGHIWFRIGEEAFDLYAPDGNRLSWVPQTPGGWEALAEEEA